VTGQLSLFDAPSAPSERAGAIAFWAERAAEADRVEPPAIPGPSHFYWQKIRQALAETFEPADGVAFVNTYRELLGQPTL